MICTHRTVTVKRFDEHQETKHFLSLEEARKYIIDKSEGSKSLVPPVDDLLEVVNGNDGPIEEVQLYIADRQKFLSNETKSLSVGPYEFLLF